MGPDRESYTINIFKHQFGVLQRPVFVDLSSEDDGEVWEDSSNSS